MNVAEVLERIHLFFAIFDVRKLVFHQVEADDGHDLLDVSLTLFYYFGSALEGEAFFDMSIISQRSMDTTKILILNFQRLFPPLNLSITLRPRFQMIHCMLRYTPKIFKLAFLGLH